MHFDVTFIQDGVKEVFRIYNSVDLQAALTRFVLANPGKRVVKIEEVILQ